MGKMTNKAARFLAAAVFLSLPAQSFGLTVDSTALAPADGTTGQTTSSGNGVKTGHIQNGAVTSPKIAVADGTTGQDVTQGSGVKTNHIQNAAVTSPKLADGAVASTKIAVADGTTGQDVTLGSGVKTNHIQNAAVTGPKLADGAVTSTKIGPGAVGINAIATGAVTSSAIAPYAVITGSILDGAVTDAKISGPISGSKINSVGLNADTVDGKHAGDFAGAMHYHAQSDVTGLTGALAGKADANHNHDALYRKKHATVIVVAKDGGDFDNPVNAINTITDASDTKPYLIQIMPGVYDLGGAGLSSKAHISIHGSGVQNTKLVSNVSGEYAIIQNTFSDISDLTLVNNGSGPCISTRNFYQSSPLNISNVDIVSSGAGIYADFSGNDFKLSNVNITSQGTAISARYNVGQLTNVRTNALVYLHADGDYTYMDNVNVTLPSPVAVPAPVSINLLSAAKIVNSSTNGKLSMAGIGGIAVGSITNSEMDSLHPQMYQLVISNTKINSGIAKRDDYYTGYPPIICSNVYNQNYQPASCY